MSFGAKLRHRSIKRLPLLKRVGALIAEPATLLMKTEKCRSSAIMGIQIATEWSC
jgi:hypothetical protein